MGDARRLTDAEHECGARRCGVDDWDGAEFGHRDHGVLRAAVRERESWRHAMAHGFDWLQHDHELRLAFVLRAKNVQPESWRRHFAGRRRKYSDARMAGAGAA